MYFIDFELGFGFHLGFGFWIDFEFEIWISDLALVWNWDTDFDMSLNSPKHCKYLFIGFEWFWGLNIKILIFHESLNFPIYCKFSYQFNIDDFGSKMYAAWLCLNPIWTGNVWQVSSTSYWIDLILKLKFAPIWISTCFKKLC